MALLSKLRFRQNEINTLHFVIEGVVRGVMVDRLSTDWLPEDRAAFLRATRKLNEWVDDENRFDLPEETVKAAYDFRRT